MENLKEKLDSRLQLLKNSRDECNPLMMDAINLLAKIYKDILDSK